MGILWWLFSCILFKAGHLLGVKLSFSAHIPRFERSIRSVNSNYVLIAYFVLGILYSVILLSTHGFSIFRITNKAELYRINNFLQGYRYSNLDENEGIVQQICLAFTYGLPTCAGYILPSAKTIKGKLLCFCGIIPNILIVVLNNAKAGLIIATILFISGYIIRYIDIYGIEPQLTWKCIRKLLFFFMAFLIFMFFAIKLRYNSDAARASTGNIIIVLREYIFGCTVNFDYYFISRIKDWSIRATILKDSNILTANMFWLHYFGYLGALLLWFVRGIISGSSYACLMQGRATIIDKVLLVYCYVSALYFFTYMAFSYTTVIIGVFFLFPFFLMTYRSKKEYVWMAPLKANM